MLEALFMNTWHEKKTLLFFSNIFGKYINTFNGQHGLVNIFNLSKVTAKTVMTFIMLQFQINAVIRMIS